MPPTPLQRALLQQRLCQRALSASLCALVLLWELNPSRLKLSVHLVFTNILAFAVRSSQGRLKKYFIRISSFICARLFLIIIACLINGEFHFRMRSCPRVITTQGRFPTNTTLQKPSPFVFPVTTLNANCAIFVKQQWPLSALCSILISNLGRFIIVRYDRSPSIIVINVLKQATTSRLFLCALRHFISCNI